MKRFRNYKIISLLSALVFLGGVRIVISAGLFLPEWDDIKMTIGTTILFLTSQVLRLAGLLFNYVIDKTINFASLIEKTGMVDIGWGILRNMSNMVFIFILLAISIATILGIENYGAKRLLTKVILVALLINFSLFATKIIIDAANVFTTGFYNATIKNAGVAATTSPGGEDWNEGISAIFAGALNLQTIYKADEMDKSYNGLTLEAENILTVALLGSVLLVITAFIFFAGSVLLMKRIVVLMFLMMISPLAFLGMILPATSGYSKQWWNTLFKEAFYAPVFMMFIYIVATAISSETFRDNISKPAADVKGFANTATGGDQMMVIFNFILITGLMLASLISASKLGASGASGMMSMGKNLQKWGTGKIKAGAGAATFGAGGRLARTAIGSNLQRGADALAKTKWAKEGGVGSKLALKTLRYGGNATYDARNLSVVKAMKLGDGIKGGYKTKREEAKKAELAYVKSLKLKGEEVKTYGEKKRGKNIWGSLTTDAGYYGQVQAGEALVQEYENKKELRDAQRELKRAKEIYEDARKKIGNAQYSNQTLVQQEVDQARENLSRFEDNVDTIKEKIKEAAEKAKTDTKPKTDKA